jgi:hypothetical protein
MKIQALGQFSQRHVLKRLKAAPVQGHLPIQACGDDGLAGRGMSPRPATTKPDTGPMLLRVPDAAGMMKQEIAIKIIAFHSIKTTSRHACPGFYGSRK